MRRRRGGIWSMSTTFLLPGSWYSGVPWEAPWPPGSSSIKPRQASHPGVDLHFHPGHRGGSVSVSAGSSYVPLSFNTVDYVGRVRCPLLIVHSRDDEMIPVAHGRRLFDAAKEPKGFLEIRGSHNDGFLTSGNRYRQGLEASWGNTCGTIVDETHSRACPKSPSDRHPRAGGGPGFERIWIPAKSMRE